jgi:hypothetical protein
MVLTGLVGTIIKGPDVVAVFLLYFVVTFMVVLLMFERTRVLRLSLYIVRDCCGTSRSKRNVALRLAHERTEAAKLLHQESLAVGLPIEIEGAEAAVYGNDAAASSRLLHGSLNGDRAGGAGGRELSCCYQSAGVRSRVDSFSALPLCSAPREGIADVSSGGGVDLSPLLGERGSAPSEAKSHSDGADADEIDDAFQLDLGDNEGLPPGSCGAKLLRAIKRRVRAINSISTVFFAKDADLVTLNKAVLYVRDNEQSSRMCVVHFVDDRAAVVDLLLQADQASIEDGTAPPSTDATLLKSSSSNRSRFSVLSPDRAVQLLESRLPPMPPEAALLMDNVAIIDAMYPKASCLWILDQRRRTRVLYSR